MAGGITFNFLANVKDFLRGTGDAEAALDDVGDALDDLAREAASEAGKAGKSIEGIGDDALDAAKEVGTATERMAGDFKSLQREVSQSTKKQADDVTRNARDSTNNARQASRDLKDEAKQNAAETFSSFNGSAASLADGIQGTLGGVIASLPPQFAIAAAAGAVAFGVIRGLFEQGEIDSQKFKEKVSELTAELIDVGDKGGPGIDYMVEKLKELATATEDGADNLEEIKKRADETDSSFSKLANAYAGNAEALAEITAEVKEQLLAQAALDEAASDGATSYGKVVSDKQTALATLNGELIELKKTTDAAALAEHLYIQAGGPELEYKAQLIGTVNAAYDESAGAVETYLNKETGLFDVAAYIAAMAARSQALIDYQNTLASSSLSTEAKGFIDSQGAEAAALFLQGYTAATPEQQAELNRIWTESGKETSGQYIDSAQAAFTAAPLLLGPGVALPEPDITSFLKNAQSKLNTTTLYVEPMFRLPSGKKVY